MKLSIITAVFNNKAFIESSIASVLSQTYPNIEHIIIDGGSTDGTLDVISRLTMTLHPPRQTRLRRAPHHSHLTIYGLSALSSE